MFTIKSVSKKVGVSEKTLNYWARRGLIKWTRQNINGRGIERIFTENDIENIKKWLLERENARLKYGL